MAFVRGYLYFDAGGACQILCNQCQRRSVIDEQPAAPAADRGGVDRLHLRRLAVTVARFETLARGHADVGALRIIGDDPLRHRNRCASRAAHAVEGGAAVDVLPAARPDEERNGNPVASMEHPPAPRTPGDTRAVCSP